MEAGKDVIVAVVSRPSKWYQRVGRLLRDERGQAMTEYIILTSVTVALAAYLYHPDNGLFQGFRNTYDKTTVMVGWPGP